MCIFYDIMNRFYQTQDPIFIDIMFEFEAYYNRILEKRAKDLEEAKEKEGIEELATSTNETPNKTAYTLRCHDTPKFGFTPNTETKNPQTN